MQPPEAKFAIRLLDQTQMIVTNSEMRANGPMIIIMAEGVASIYVQDSRLEGPMLRVREQAQLIGVRSFFVDIAVMNAALASLSDSNVEAPIVASGNVSVSLLKTSVKGSTDSRLLVAPSASLIQVQGEKVQVSRPGWSGKPVQTVEIFYWVVPGSNPSIRIATTN